MRNYDGEVQDLKVKEKTFELQDRSLAEGIVLGGQINLAYSIRKKQQRCKTSNLVYTVDNGPFISCSYRYFDEIRQLTFEAGWIISEENINMTQVSRFVVFMSINEFIGALRGKFYNIGIRSNLSFKELFSN